MLPGLPCNDQTALHFTPESLPPALLTSLRSSQPQRGGGSLPAARARLTSLRGTFFFLKRNQGRFASLRRSHSVLDTISWAVEVSGDCGLYSNCQA